MGQPKQRKNEVGRGPCGGYSEDCAGENDVQIEPRVNHNHTNLTASLFTYLCFLIAASAPEIERERGSLI